MVEEARNADGSLVVQVDWTGSGQPLLADDSVSMYDFVVLLGLVDPGAVTKAAACIAETAVIVVCDVGDAVIEHSDSVDGHVSENDSIQSRLCEKCWVFGW